MGIGGGLMFWFMGPSTAGGLKSVGIGAGDLWKMTRAASSGEVGRMVDATIGTPAQGTAAGGGDAVSEIERADRLRREGAITDAEFERLKREALNRL
jgi:hypothetical protein